MPVTATTALAKRGLSLLEAKRTIEKLVAEGHAVVELPTVEDRYTVQQELAEAGVACAPCSEGRQR